MIYFFLQELNEYIYNIMNDKFDIDDEFSKVLYNILLARCIGYNN